MPQYEMTRLIAADQGAIWSILTDSDLLPFFDKFAVGFAAAIEGSDV